ncbi:MAG: T9SS type A sorting domain-containing protein [Ignavibacteria bacterium]|nr:T9SS type A sorting domain-containing protein [Ignavibacteria bacterium]
MKHRLSLSLALLLLAVSSAALDARVLHVGPGQPYANIEAAAATAQPGDTIALHAGTYAAYQFVEGLHGTPSGEIVITRYADDAPGISGMWQFRSCSYLRFSKLVFRATAAKPGRLLILDNGGSCATQTHHIVIDSCAFLDVSDPANSALKFAGVDSFAVRRCVFGNLAAGAFDLNTCHQGVIAECRFENCLTGGHIKGGASFITMERNLFLNASRDGWVAFEFGGDTSLEFYCPGSTTEVNDLKFHSNIVVGGYRGLALSSAVHCDVASNTFYETGQATMRFLTTSTHFPALTGNTVRNNIFAFGAASQYMNGSQQSAGAVSFEGNIYCSTVSAAFNGPYWDSPALDAVKDPKPLLYGNAVPMFIAAASGDFHLAAGSPAIAAGAAASDPALDFYGKPFATKRSIGAAEYATSTSVIGARAPAPAALRVTPNPAGENIVISLNASDAARAESIEIFSLLGVRVMKTAAYGHLAGAETLQQISVASLPAGMYLLRVGTHAALFTKAGTGAR